MKRKKITLLLCIITVLVVLMSSVCLVACDDDKNEVEKQDAFIFADLNQTFVYDGQVHNVEATLNHDEAQLTFSPARGYSEIGEYDIVVSAPETEHYKAASSTVRLTISAPGPKSTAQLWNDLLADVEDAFALNGKDKLKLNVQASANVKNGSKTTEYAIDVMGNLDLSEAVNNSSLFHAVISADGNRVGIYYQDGAMYLEVVDQIFKVKNSNLTKLLTANNSAAALAGEESGSNILGLVKSLLPMLLFRNADDIVYTDGLYELTIDFPHVWSVVSNDFVSNLIKDIVSKDNMTILDTFFKANEMQFKFAIDLSDNSNALANVKVENGKAYLGAFEIAGGSYDFVSGKLPADKIQAAEEMNLANAVVDGTIELVDRKGKAYEHLSYKLVADIDVLAIVDAVTSKNANWADLDGIKNSKFYFSLYHKHTPGDGVECTDAMCPTRVGGMDDTTLLDIAFDPTNFGNSKVYLAANLSRVFSDASFSATLSNVLSIASLLANTVKDVKTQNFLTSIDLGVLLGAASEPGDPSDPSEPSDPDDGFKFETSMIDPIVSIITTCINLENGALTLNLEETYALLNKAFNLDSLVNLEVDILGNINVINTTSFANAVMKGILSPDGAQDTNAQFNSLRISADSVKLGEAESFNCKEAITHLPTDVTVEREFGGGKPLAFTNANPKATGRVFQTKESLGDIFTADDGIYFALEDMGRLIGKNLEYTYTATDGQQYTATTQIVALDGLDTTKINEVQHIKAIVLPLDGQGGMLSDGLWKVLNAVYGFSLVGNNLPTHIALPIRGDVIDIDVMLTEYISTVDDLVVDEECPGRFELDDFNFNSNAYENMSPYMFAKFTVKYSNGKSYVADLVATSDNLSDGAYLTNDGKEHSFTYSYYGIELKTIEVSAYDPEDTKLYENKSGDKQVIKIATYGADQGIKLNAVVRSGKYQTSSLISTDQYRLLINGKTLDELGEFSSDGKQLFEFDVQLDFKKTANAVSRAYIFFSLEGRDNETVIYSVEYSKVAQGAVWGSIPSSTKNLGSALDGKLTYNYWKDSDDEYAPVRTLTLKYENGKYYMVDNMENPTVKIDVTLTADKVTLTADGLISDEDMMKLHLDANKSTATPSLKITAKFEVEGAEVTTSAKSISFARLIDFTYVKYDSKIAAETVFDDLVKFIVLVGDESHEMRLKYVDGAYLLRDTYDGDGKLADIAVTVNANIATSSTGIGDAIELVDGKLSADQVGKKVTLTFKFSYNGLEIVAANKINNKTVVAAA